MQRSIKTSRAAKSPNSQQEGGNGVRSAPKGGLHAGLQGNARAQHKDAMGLTLFHALGEIHMQQL
jgi:hypothetical protein